MVGRAPNISFNYSCLNVCQCRTKNTQMNYMQQTFSPWTLLKHSWPNYWFCKFCCSWKRDYLLKSTYRRLIRSNSDGKPSVHLFAKAYIEAFNTTTQQRNKKIEAQKKPTCLRNNNKTKNVCYCFSCCFRKTNTISH